MVLSTIVFANIIMLWAVCRLSMWAKARLQDVLREERHHEGRKVTDQLPGL